MCPFPIYPLYTRTVILSLDKPIADCFLFRPRKSREKRRKRSHINASSTLSTRSSTPPAQTAHTAKQGPSLPRPQCGFALPVKFFYSATLLYTYISRFSVNPHYQQQFYLRPSFIAFFNLSHKRPTFASIPESGYTPGFRRRIAHSGLHAETGAFRTEGAITTLGAFRTFTNIPGPGVRTANFAGSGVLIWCTPEERREPAGQRCAHARRCSEASRPRRAA